MKKSTVRVQFDADRNEVELAMERTGLTTAGGVGAEAFRYYMRNEIED
jgi:hypothetical protein